MDETSFCIPLLLSSLTDLSKKKSKKKEKLAAVALFSGKIQDPEKSERTFFAAFNIELMFAWHAAASTGSSHFKIFHFLMDNETMKRGLEPCSKNFCSNMFALNSNRL
jgi:hypothetical protein